MKVTEGRNRQNSKEDSEPDSDNSYRSRGFKKRVSDRKTIKELREALEVETQSNIRKLERESLLKKKAVDLEHTLASIQEEKVERL